MLSENGVPGGAADGGTDQDRHDYTAQPEQGEREVEGRKREVQNVNSEHLHLQVYEIMLTQAMTHTHCSYINLGARDAYSVVKVLSAVL